MVKSIAGVIAVLLIVSLLHAQQEDLSKVEIKVSKVAGNVYMLEGAGGNIGALVGEDGIVIVDDQFAPLAEKIRAALKGITQKPVRFVINTHWHDDHVGGNEPFSKTSTILAHENVRKRMQAGGFAGNGGSLRFESKPAPREALPVVTFRQDSTLHLNGEDIEIIHYPAGHTDGDAIVFFRKSGVVHMGDDFARYGFPFIDVDAGGSVKGMIQAIEKVLVNLPADAKIIPGHGELSTPQDLRVFVKMLKDTTAAVEKVIEQKKSLEDMKKEKILEPWKEYSSDFINEDAFIETLYNSLTGKKKAAFIQHN